MAKKTQNQTATKEMTIVDRIRKQTPSPEIARLMGALHVVRNRYAEDEEEATADELFNEDPLAIALKQAIYQQVVIQVANGRFRDFGNVCALARLSRASILPPEDMFTLESGEDVDPESLEEFVELQFNIIAEQLVGSEEEDEE